MDTTIKRGMARLTRKIVMPMILCMFLAFGCEDVFEKDLSKKVSEPVTGSRFLFGKKSRGLRGIVW